MPRVWRATLVNGGRVVKNRRKNTLLIIGFITLLVSTVIFTMLTKEKTSLSFLSFGFILFSEILFFGGMLFVENTAENNAEVMLRAGTYSVLTLYLIASVIISIMYIAKIWTKTSNLIAIQAVILGGAAIAIILINISSKRVYENENKINKSYTRGKELVSRVKVLLQNEENSFFSRELEKVIDSLSYGDFSITIEQDVTIESMINELENILLLKSENYEKNAQIKIKDILILIKERELKVKNIKVGGI